MLKKQNTQVQIAKNLTKNLKVAIIRTDYYKELNDNLEKHCRKTLIANGVDKTNIETFVAPGSWEIPLMVQEAAKSKRFEAIVAFGVIVKGETYHFNMIANECARALMELSLDYSIPIALGVLAVFDKNQALERAGDNDRNKGVEAAIAVLKSLETLKKFKK
ncbi:MAG: 6,7-dimethyl-8-ribityllumazine synthase [Candidatus Levybacteria bacterium]|nr:6,7-dimethyl-8-ribityllumazine synthase [Candidatus Levybacteria bacterium]